MLLPAGAFSDRPATEDDFRRLCARGTPRGRHARAVQRRLASGCAGWKRRPTAEEFYDAVRAEQPTDRQASIIRMWGAEATAGELIEAWVQHAYTLRQLVAALHRANFGVDPTMRSYPLNAKGNLGGRRGRRLGRWVRNPLAAVPREQECSGES